MTGKAMREEFKLMLGRKNETLSHFIQRTKAGERGCRDAAVHTAYEIGGIAYAAYGLGLIDYDEQDNIQRAALDAAMGKEPEYEAC